MQKRPQNNFKETRLNTGRFAVATAIIALAAVAGATDLFQAPYNTGTTSSTISYSPVSIGNYNFDQVETGATHTVARLGNKVYTWGSNNDYGQLGRTGTFAVPTQITSFEDVNGNTIATPKIVDVAAGDNFCVAIDDKGKIYNWGTLAGNDRADRPHRQDWASFTALDVVAGGGHGLILSNDWGTIKLRGFGDNTYGEAGNWSGGNINLNGTYPLSLQDFNYQNINASNIVSFSAGYDHSSFALADGRVFSFGRNDNGQLAYGTTLDLHNNLIYRQWIPAKNSDGSFVNNAVEVAAGNGYTLVRTSTGEVLSVGNNTGGQLGRGGDATKFGSTGLSGATRLSAGYNYAMAVVGSDVYNWGFKVTSNTTADTLTSPTVFKGFHDFGLLEAGNLPVNLNGPWDSTYLANGGGVTLFTATEVPVPVFLKTELYTSQGARAGLDYIGGQTGFVRIYSNIAASDGNGPTFTPVSTSGNYWFSGSAKVADGTNYVDVPLMTLPVTMVDRSAFNVEQSNGNTITGKKINVFTPIADGVTAENLSHPGAAFKAGDTLRLSVHLPYAAGASGYALPFTSDNASVLSDGTFNIGAGGTSGSIDFVVPAIVTNFTLKVTVDNNGGATNLITRLALKKK